LNINYIKWKLAEQKYFPVLIFKIQVAGYQESSLPPSKGYKPFEGGGKTETFIF
jgi:hypothetical protein